MDILIQKCWTWVVVVALDAQAVSEVPPQDSADPSSPVQEQDDAMGARSLPWLIMRHAAVCKTPSTKCFW